MVERNLRRDRTAPTGLFVVLLLVLLALFLPRRKAIVPLFIAAATIPMAQRLVIFGADFTMLRILIVAYFARVIIRDEFRSIGWNRLDTAMLWWSISATVVMILATGLRGPRVSFRAVV